MKTIVTLTHDLPVESIGTPVGKVRLSAINGFANREVMEAYILFDNVIEEEWNDGYCELRCCHCKHGRMCYPYRFLMVQAIYALSRVTIHELVHLSCEEMSEDETMRATRAIWKVGSCPDFEEGWAVRRRGQPTVLEVF